jgi:hypothetical protein
MRLWDEEGVAGEEFGELVLNGVRPGGIYIYA